MNKLSHYTLTAIASLLIALTTACSSDDEAAKPAIEAPQISVLTDKTSANRIAFTYTGDSKTYEYAGTLKSASGDLIFGTITNDTDWMFPLVYPNTKYVFSVTAYPRLNDSYSGSTTSQVEIHTLPVSYAASILNKDVTISWKNLTDVDKVRYTLLDKTTNKTVSGKIDADAPLNITVDNIGDYEFALVTLFIGSDSLVVSNCDTTITVEDPLKVVWSVSGTAYLEGLGKTVNATLKAHLNNTYTIERWYDADGDIHFALNDDTTISPLNAKSSTRDKFFNYMTNRSEDSDDIYQVTINKEKSFAYDANGIKTTTLSQLSGKIKLYMSSLSNADGDDMDATGDGNYIFQW